jgi:uncharacterized protein YfdQ (DUF2303 family)
MDDNTSNAAAIIEHVTKNLAPVELDAERGSSDGARLHLIPKELTVFDPKKILDQYLPAPERRKGTTNLADVASFCAHVNRFKSDASLVYADLGDAPALTCVYDHDPAGPSAAGWCSHRARYTFPLSAEWQAWKRAHGQGQSQSDFAAFIEERSADLLDVRSLEDDHPMHDLLARLRVTPSDAAAVAEAVTLASGEAELVTLASGEAELVFSERHQGDDGKPLVVPTAFLIAIPVFRVFLVRLRHRRNPTTARIAWTVSLHQVDVVDLAASREVLARVGAETSVPVLVGTPPLER